MVTLKREEVIFFLHLQRGVQSIARWGLCGVMKTGVKDNPNVLAWANGRTELTFNETGVSTGEAVCLFCNFGGGGEVEGQEFSFICYVWDAY